MMPGRAELVFIVLIAATHAACFIAYQRPDWDSHWTDQNGYMRLGHALAQTGRFTRAPDSPQFVPEAGRTPGYPVFIALVERVLGRGHLAIAIAQAGVFVVICLLTYSVAKTVATERVATAAGLITALYPPLPYFGALAMSEVLTVATVTAGILFWLHALRRDDSIGWLVASGAAFAWAALTRPIFLYLPVFLVACDWLLVPRARPARRVRSRLAMIAAFLAVLTPWLIYNAVYFKTLTFRGAGVGRVLFEGVWQVEWPGHVEATLTSIADRTIDRAELDRRVRVYAATVQMPPEPMLEYVHEWQDVRKIWVEPTGAMDRPFARVAANHEYLRVALEKIRRDPLRHALRRATLAPLLLWVTDIPVRYSDINQLSPWVIRAMWLLQLLGMLLAARGLVVVWRRGLRVEAAAFAAVLLYVTAVHVPLYTEGRYSLPAKPIAIVLAAVAVGEILARRATSPIVQRSSPLAT
jgi:4-amino-4-deoxy-L-arabinose transferase-like glycosyltransferase